MNVNYFKDELSVADALTIEADAREENISPEQCFRVVRETMEELAYRTAVTYSDNDKPSLYYWTTVKGISCYEIDTRDDQLGRVSLPSAESRLLG